MVERIKNSRKSKMAALAAALLFAAATFQIADDNTLLGVVLFASAACFSSIAGVCHGRVASEDSGDTRQ